MTTTSISIIEAKEELSELVNRVAHQQERIILTRRDKEVAAIISLEDLKQLEESRNKNDLEEATEALKEARSAGTITLDELKTDIG